MFLTVVARLQPHRGDGHTFVGFTPDADVLENVRT